MLIDFGSTHAPRRRTRLLPQAATLIEQHTNGQLDVLVATHRHKDHIDGFGLAETAAVIGKLKPGLVVRPWTDDPKLPADTMGPALRSASHRLAASLVAGQQFASLVATLVGAADTRSLRGELAGLAVDQLPNKQALDNLVRWAEDGVGVYVAAGDDSKIEQFVPGIDVRVLGPPTARQAPEMISQRANDPEYWLAQHAQLEGSVPASLTAEEPEVELEPTGVEPGPVGWLVERLHRYRDANLNCVTSTESETCPANAFGQTPDLTLRETYAWDQRDRLLGFSRFQGSDPVTSSYRNDPLDRPVHEEERRGQTTRTTDFTYLGLTDSVSSETQAQGGSSTVRSYSYGPDDERVGMTANGGVTGDFYYERNVHTDISLLVRAGNTADPEASYVYHPYGAPDALSDGDPEDAEPLSAYRFNDKRFDPGSMTMDMGARRFNNDLGRFLTEDVNFDSSSDLDVVTETVTQNRYAFAAANPIHFLETDGHRFAAGRANRACYSGPPPGAPAGPRGPNGLLPDCKPRRTRTCAYRPGYPLG